MHPVVEDLVNHEYAIFYQAFEDHSDLDCPLTQYVLRMRNVAQDDVRDDLLAELDAYEIKSQDPLLLGIFHLAWSNFAYKKHPDLSYLILKRARKYLEGSPDNLAFLADTYERGFHLRQGDISKVQEDIQRDYLPSTETRKIHTAARFLSRFGLLRDVVHLDDLSVSSEEPQDLDVYRLVDAIENFDYGEIQNRLTRLIDAFGGKENLLAQDNHRIALKTCLALYPMALKWQNKDLKEYRYTSTHAAVSEIPENLNHFLEVHLKTLTLLSENKAAKALKNHLTTINEEINAELLPHFFSYNHVRCELSKGNPEAAENLIAKRQTRGFKHHVDDFFLSRAALLKKNHDLASQLLHRAYENFKVYGLNRLNVECALSAELQYSDIVNLLERQPQFSKSSVSSEHHSQALDRIVGDSAPIREIKKNLPTYAGSDLPVLILGDTGTGKELIARAIHECGPRAAKPFTAINCGAITPTLLMSELFGHEQGAFSGANSEHRGIFESTEDGTLFMDEVGELSLEAQVSLLRVLENQTLTRVGSSESIPVHCRVIAATNRDLQSAIEAKSFRSDLLFRLKRITVNLPSLSQRGDDLSIIMEHFIRPVKSTDSQISFDDDLLKTLTKYSWPGNIRECRNEMEWLGLMHSSKTHFTIEDLNPDFIKKLENDIAHSAPTETPPTTQLNPQPFTSTKIPAFRRRERLAQLFKEHRELTLMEVVELLGVSKSTAVSDLKQLREKGVIEKVSPSGAPSSQYFRILN